eukprot:scaffold61871_cov65-Phaeocystis_antarctica.AAC.9
MAAATASASCSAPAAGGHAQLHAAPCGLRATRAPARLVRVRGAAHGSQPAAGGRRRRSSGRPASQLAAQRRVAEAGGGEPHAASTAAGIRGALMMSIRPASSLSTSSPSSPPCAREGRATA